MTFGSLPHKLLTIPRPSRITNIQYADQYSSARPSSPLVAHITNNDIPRATRTRAPPTHRRSPATNPPPILRHPPPILRHQATRVRGDIHLIGAFSPRTSGQKATAERISLSFAASPLTYQRRSSHSRGYPRECARRRRRW